MTNTNSNTTLNNHFFSLSFLMTLINWKQFMFSAPWLVGSYLLHIVETGVWLNISPIILLLCFVSYASLRVFAMSVNQLADKRFDEKNPRTKDRLLCTGEVSANQVMWVIVMSALIFLISTVCMIYTSNVRIITWMVIAIPLVIACLGYSYLKRFTAMSHLFLGLILGSAPILIRIPLNIPISSLCVFYGVIMGLMIMSSDMCYALQDEIFDVNEGLYSFPAVYGTEMTRIAVQVTHAVIIGLICVLGQGLSSVIMVLSCFILIGVFVRVTDYDDSTTMNILNLNVTMAIFSSLLLEVLWQFMY